MVKDQATRLVGVRIRAKNKARTELADAMRVESRRRSALDALRERQQSGRDTLLRCHDQFLTDGSLSADAVAQAFGYAQRLRGELVTLDNERSVALSELDAATAQRRVNAQQCRRAKVRLSNARKRVESAQQQSAVIAVEEQEECALEAWSLRDSPEWALLK